ncbi:MAG TPA: 1-acyl-sn-glycerol-3-phosphate acyltransferase, partial [Clostridiaceae bacterium]|nr:1-acyl-sn-glycerol-3-phosphate acyltransferase [Clostridiaceae bacterium]
MLFYKICKPVPWLFYHIFYRLKVYGKQNIPKEDGAIICPNHRSNHDSVIVAVTCPRPV